MSDEQYRRRAAGKYPEDDHDFTPSDEANRKMKKKQKELDETFSGPVVEAIQKLRNRSREELEDIK